MIVSKPLVQALVFNKVSVMDYVIENNLLDCYGWKYVRKLVHDTTADYFISFIRLHVGQLQQDNRKRRLKKKNEDL
jgi:hypothetical protein